MTTKIEWCMNPDGTRGEVWNPVTGCNKVSQGCKHCYAETIAERFWATQYPPNADGSPRKFTDVRLHPERLEEPLRWKKPRRVFVNSMSDLFHEDIGFEIWKIFDIMAQTPQHTYMILTKRPKNMFSFCQEYDPHDLAPYPLPNVWLGVSVEDQKTADERIPLLLQTPAAVRFVSYEPALGPVDFGAFMSPPGSSWSREVALAWDDTSELDWVIMGGESGPHARPMHPDWARSVRDQCQAAGVPFFFKQWGEWTTVYPKGMRSLAGIKEAYADGEHYYRIGKGAAGRMLDGREWNEFPEPNLRAEPRNLCQCERFLEDPEPEILCACGRLADESCGICGEPLCYMCFETGAGFCHGEHTNEQIDEYAGRIYGDQDPPAGIGV